MLENLMWPVLFGQSTERTDMFLSLKYDSGWIEKCEKQFDELRRFFSYSMKETASFDYLHYHIKIVFLSEAMEKNISEREVLSWRKRLINDNPGSKIPLILQDLRRILTRKSCKSLQETYKIAYKTSYKIPCQDVLPRFLPRFLSRS